jgi:pimeloyl-ACP methyl ester carboxylesterase
LNPSQRVDSLTAPPGASYDRRTVPAGFATKYIDIDGATLHFLHSGPTTLPDCLPPLDRGALFVLVHGGGRNAADWKRQLAGLGDRHGVVAPDLPGHGRTPGIEGLPTIEAYADVVGRFVGRVARRRCVLVGWSMGFSIALVEAARHPERYAGLVLMGGLPYWRPDPALLEPYRDVVRGRRPQGFDTLLFSPATSMNVMREAWTEQVKTDPRVFYGDLLAGAAFDGRALLGRIAMPTLGIHGADDKLVSEEQARAIIAAIPDARLEVVPEAGHIAQLEQPERVNALLAAFAEGLAERAT